MMTMPMAGRIQSVKSPETRCRNMTITPARMIEQHTTLKTFRPDTAYVLSAELHPDDSGARALVNLLFTLGVAVDDDADDDQKRRND